MEWTKCDAKEETKDPINNKLNIKRFLKTPCAADSLINGIHGGIGLGLGSFLYSRNVKRACDVAVGSWVIISIGSWLYCYEKRVRYANTMKIIAALEQKKKVNTKTNLNEES